MWFGEAPFRKVIILDRLISLLNIVRDKPRAVDSLSTNISNGEDNAEDQDAGAGGRSGSDDQGDSTDRSATFIHFYETTLRSAAFYVLEKPGPPATIDPRRTILALARHRRVQYPVYLQPYPSLKLVRQTRNSRGTGPLVKEKHPGMTSFSCPPTYIASRQH